MELIQSKSYFRINTEIDTEKCFTLRIMKYKTPSRICPISLIIFYSFVAKALTVSIKATFQMVAVMENVAGLAYKSKH